MKLLIYLHDSPWPIRSGQQLHTYNMIQALASLGHDVHLTAYGDVSTLPPDKHLGWSVSRLTDSCDGIVEQAAHPFCERVAKRWMRYWGIPVWVLSSLKKQVLEYRPDTVILVGLQALPLTAGTVNVPTIWYAADDWVLHHLTLAKKGFLRDRLRSLRSALVSLCYERSLSAQLRGAIAVSTKDQAALRWAGGFRRVALIPNGVDAEYFFPHPDKHIDKPSLCFWGRMDFEPNIDAMVWFCRDIWPLLLGHFPDAELTIVGASPTPEVWELGKHRNVSITGEVEDVRPFAWTSQVVVMPMRIGGGIKNKLLEACALGKPVVASPRAVADLGHSQDGLQPWMVAQGKEEWVKAITLLWSSPETRTTMANSARKYIVHNHSWRQAASTLVRFVHDIQYGR